MKSLSKNIIKINHPISGVTLIRAGNDEAVVPENDFESSPPESEFEPAFPEAENFVQLSESELQARLEAAFRQGREDGYQSALEETRSEFSQTTENLKNIIQQLNAGQEELLQSSEQALLSLVFKLVQKIVGTISEQQRDVIKATLQKIINQEKIHSKINIHIHPNDLQTVRNIEPELRNKIPDLQELGILQDTSVSPGGCIIESELGKLDARIDTQLSEMENQLKKLYDLL